MSDLPARAQAVLRSNRAGGWTKPSPSQYPHQWNWDSAFISIGWSCFDWEAGRLELESLLRGQWDDGMLPHVRYDPRRLDGYFPGPDWWPGARRRVRRAGELTSGISNPPVVVLAAEVLLERAPSREARRALLESLFPGLRDFVGWFPRSRTLRGSPLPVTVHPWESGWDNSPRWDFLAGAGLRASRPYQRLDTEHVSGAERPTGKDYDSFLALAEMLDAVGYDLSRYRERSPFCVHDVLIDALWHRAACVVNEMAAELGMPPVHASTQLEEFARAFQEFHWDPAAGAYVDYDLVEGRRLPGRSAAGVAALAGGLAPADRGAEAWERYTAAAAGLRLLPSALPGPWFEPARYWRGPVWLNINWLAAQGLRRLGRSRDANELEDGILALAENGFWEYHHAETGEGIGIRDFSWSAALVLDLLQRKGKPVG